MNLHRVRDHFEGEAFEYDSLIDRLIPCYKEQHEVMLAVIPLDRSSKLTALDLGCGTGVLSHLLLRSFPNVEVTAFDIAKNMLDVCRRNLSGYSSRLTLQHGNFGEDHLGENYDIVVSGLSIHHLCDSDKQRLYRRIFDAMSPGGIFVNREIVMGGSAYLTDLYHALWRRYIAENGEDDEKWFMNYQQEDIPASVEDQMSWLTDAGFVDVGCHWRYLNFAIFGGRKPEIGKTGK